VSKLNKVEQESLMMSQEVQELRQGVAGEVRRVSDRVEAVGGEQAVVRRRVNEMEKVIIEMKKG
jgi:hypothetical protein